MDRYNVCTFPARWHNDNSNYYCQAFVTRRNIHTFCYLRGRYTDHYTCCEMNRRSVPISTAFHIKNIVRP